MSFTVKVHIIPEMSFSVNNNGGSITKCAFSKYRRDLVFVEI
jgi:hypothetical protein